MPAALNREAVSEQEAEFEKMAARRGPVRHTQSSAMPLTPDYRKSGHMADMGSSRMDAGRRMSVGSTYSTYMQDGALLGPNRPRPHKIWKKKYVKLLIIGDSGLGKTTLIRTLMSTPGDRLHAHDGSHTPKERFFKDPDSLCSTISWRDEEDRTVWVYKIQDTPGYGDEIDTQACIVRMTKFIEEQHVKWLELEQSKQRKEDLQEVDDPRIDLCLFCIPPHRLRCIDIKYMYELGRYVPVVPIVTKADTMTIREASTYRTEVANKLANPMIPGVGDKINLFHFERDTKERAGIHDHGTPCPPFLVIASNEVNEELNCADVPTYWPERRYPWGCAEAFNRDHSDLLSLRALLLKEALEEISRSKRQRYEAWRRKRLGGWKLGQKLVRMMMWTIVPAAICLQIGRSDIQVHDLRNKLTNTWDKVRNRLPMLKGKEEGADAGAENAAAVLEADGDADADTVAPAPAKKQKRRRWLGIV